MKIDLKRSEIWLVKFALKQKIDQLKNNCVIQRNIINRLERESNYDVRSSLELARTLLKDNQEELKKHIEVYEKFI